MKLSVLNNLILLYDFNWSDMVTPVKGDGDPRGIERSQVRSHLEAKWGKLSFHPFKLHNLRRKLLSRTSNKISTTD